LERLRNMLNLPQRWRGHRLIVVVRSTFKSRDPRKTKILKFQSSNA